MSDTKTSARDVPSGGGRTERTTERTVSLKADGTQKWFIPPFVLPAFIIVLVAGRAIYLS